MRKIDIYIKKIKKKVITYTWWIDIINWKPSFLERTRTKEQENEFMEWLKNEFKVDRKMFKALTFLPNNKSNREKVANTFLFFLPRTINNIENIW